MITGMNLRLLRNLVYILRIIGRPNLTSISMGWIMGVLTHGSTLLSNNMVWMGGPPSLSRYFFLQLFDTFYLNIHTRLMFNKLAISITEYLGLIILVEYRLWFASSQGIVVQKPESVATFFCVCCYQSLGFDSRLIEQHLSFLIFFHVPTSLPLSFSFFLDFFFEGPISTDVKPNEKYEYAKFSCNGANS